jgi:hypothetical protein
LELTPLGAHVNKSFSLNKLIFEESTTVSIGETIMGKNPYSLYTLISLRDRIDDKVSGIIVMSLKSNFLFI